MPIPRGFTLVELAIAAGAAATLTALAWPTLADHMMRARRADATLALERVGYSQARHHALHGRYADSLLALGGQAASSEGLYELSLVAGPGDRYLAVARARVDGPQARDSECREMTLSVDQAFQTLGPTRRCWNR